jgi:tryptophan 2,3-dioxygenase
MQFRELEFVSGAKDEKLLQSFTDDEFAHKRLTERFDKPSLADAFWNLLERNDFKVETSDEKIKSVVVILTNPEKHSEFFLMQDLLVEHDENIALWRYHHVLMVERMMGMKRGTGGSEGVNYLRSTLEKRFFPELWEARTHLQAKG